MTQRAAAVAEVRVLNRSYPVPAADEFQRTHVEVSILKTFKGELPETIVLDLPGGVRGNQVFAVADSAEFEIGETTIVFIKEPQQGQYMVQDLGLGKLNIVSRDGATFVESAICPKAMEAGNGGAADLLKKSIPYNDFSTLIASYSKNEEPAISPIKLAMTLPQSGSHLCDPNKPCSAILDARKLDDSAKHSTEWMRLALCAVFMALCAGTVVYVRRRNARNLPLNSSIKSVALVLSASLLAGAALGGSYSLAFVATGPVWNLADTYSPSKVSSGKILWSQSVQGSKSNANCFADVQSSFDKWSSVANCTLRFTNAGTTSNTVHSSNDGVNVVVWDSNPNSDFSSATLAITYSLSTFGAVSNFIDCDIVFNDRDFNWGASGNGNAKSVSLHEIGHFVGLSHISNSACVMYPYDGGMLQLSPDEILAAQTLYPAAGVTTQTQSPSSVPPTAAVSGSPLSGTAPLNCGFDAGASTPGSSAIASYAWNFGDGSSASGKTAGHLYSTPGVYTATVTVTDANGGTSSAAVTVNVSSSSTPVKGAFKLQFNTSRKDSFFAVVRADGLTPYAPAATINGTVSIAGINFPFTYDPTSGKAVGTNGMKLAVSPKNGTLTIALKSVDLQTAFATVGATNNNLSGETVNVPVTVVFGDGSALTVYNQFPFTYSAVASKSGLGSH